MKIRELGTIIIIIALAMAFFAAHEASHVASEKITGQPVTSLPVSK